MKILAGLDEISAPEVGWLTGFVDRALCANILYLPFPQLVSLYLRIEPNSVVFDF
jgi:hypothetical protein